MDDPGTENMFRRYIRQREEYLASQEDANKLIEPWETGTEYLLESGPAGQSLSVLQALVRQSLEAYESFFEPGPSPAYDFSDELLRFRSPIVTETAANNTVYCTIREARSRRRAVLLLPHWNSSRRDYDRLARWFRRFGITTAQMSLPYHDERRPASAKIGSLMVSANLGRTIRSCRQAVLDARLAINWLEARGYERIGLMGVSLGSSLATMVAAHDERVKAAVMLLLASRFGEVVWTSRATRHIRQALEGRLSLEQLEGIWSILSPLTYTQRLRERDIPVLVLSGREDAVFQPYLTHEIMGAYRREGVRHSWRLLPCGHYTWATFPFNIYMLLAAVRFFHQYLASRNEPLDVRA